jgi:hypothetical protein
MRALLFAVSVVLCNGCMTPRSVIEIPPCADRVEMTGQVDRMGNNRFELDHTFDLMLTRTQLSFQSNGKVQTFVVESNQPDPLRLFFGIGAVVGGALLVGNASYEVSERGADPYAAVPFWSTIGGTSLIVLGIGGAVTGWHPGQSYITFPDACPR